MGEHRELSLYEQVGGEAAMRAAVIKMYTSILTDDLLVPFFEGISVDRLRKSQLAFITMALGGPHAYSGDTLRHAHQRLVDKGLSDMHFNRVAHHLKTALQELGVSGSIIDKVLAVVETTRQDVLCK